MLVDALELLSRVTRMAFASPDELDFTLSLRPQKETHVLMVACDGDVFSGFMQDEIESSLLGLIECTCVWMDVRTPAGMKRFPEDAEKSSGTPEVAADSNMNYVEMEVRASGLESYNAILSWCADCLPPVNISMQVQGRIVRSRAPLSIRELTVGLLRLPVEVHHPIDDDRPGRILVGGVPLFQSPVPYTINIMDGATWMDAKMLDRDLVDAVKAFDD